MTQLTYTLDEIEGPFEVSPDRSVKFEEIDGINYAAVTVQLPGRERVSFLFTVKQLVASGNPESFSGQFLLPSYRRSSFLDSKRMGGSTGYENAVALPAGGRGDMEELSKEKIKNVASSTGTITLSVTKSKLETGEVIGVFESLQPSDTDLGAKTPKDVIMCLLGHLFRSYQGQFVYELPSAEVGVGDVGGARDPNTTATTAEDKEEEEGGVRQARKYQWDRDFSLFPSKER